MFGSPDLGPSSKRAVAPVSLTTGYETLAHAQRHPGVSRLVTRVRNLRHARCVYVTFGSVAVIGYARVSTREQNVEGQTDQLRAAGCVKIFVDHASGTLARRPALNETLDYLRDGDTLVVTKLDRLGRSVKHLKDVVDTLQDHGIGLRAISQGIDTTTAGGRLFFHLLAAIAEFEHDLVVERTHDGLAAARARGRKGGPPVQDDPDQGQTGTRHVRRRRAHRSGDRRHLRGIAAHDLPTSVIGERHRRAPLPADGCPRPHRVAGSIRTFQS